MEIREGGLDDARVVALLKFHFDTNISVTPAGSAHVFDVERLKSPDIRFWSAWDGEQLRGVGALKKLSVDDGEVKSMHVAEAARRRGIAAAMLARIVDEAKKMGLSRLYLETGSFDFFAPARALYAGAGFIECQPFVGYKPDANSTFMMRDI
jgi:putative acetyltransferase